MNQFLSSLQVIDDESGLYTYTLEEKLKHYHTLIEDFAWGSMEIDYQDISSATVSTYSRFNTMKVNIVGVTPNIFEILNKDFLDIDYSQSALPLGEQLYTKRNENGAGIGRYLADRLNVLKDNQFGTNQFLIHIDHGQYMEYFLTEPAFILNGAPGFMMKSRRSFIKENALVSIPHYLALLGSMQSRTIENIKFKN